MQQELLSWITCTPLIGMLIVLAIPGHFPKLVKLASLAAALVPLILATCVYFGPFEGDASGRQLALRFEWMRGVRAEYHVGIDGLSLALVWSTSLLCSIAVIASFSLERAGRACLALLLLLEACLIGAFVSLDLFLFFGCCELATLAIFFLTGVWGGPRRAGAARRFALSTLAGSMLILIAIVALRLEGGSSSIPTLAELARTGKLTGANLPGGGSLFGASFQSWCFWFLCIGFATRLPLVPLHSWLVDAQVESAAPISILTVGVWTKLGAFGLLRVCFPILPAAVREFAFALGALGVISIGCGALAAWRASDFKRLVACVAASQMGFVLVGTATAQAWNIRHVELALFAQGISLAALILVADVIEKRVGTLELAQLGGLRQRALRLCLYSGVLGLAALAAPGFWDFVGQAYAAPRILEVLDPRFRSLLVIAAPCLALGPLILLWRMKRMFLGALASESANMSEVKPREEACLVLLIVPCAVLVMIPAVVNDLFGAAAQELAQLLQGHP